MVVVHPPGLDPLPGVVEADKPVEVEALVSETPVEGLDEAILDRLARPDEGQLHAMLVGPLIQSLYEVDPLLCPFCGAEMEILAFILDFATAKAIRKSLELPDQEPEPLAHAPPDTLELMTETA